MKLTLTVISVLALSTWSFAQQAPPREPPPVIIVTGSAQVEASPDEATVRLGVVRQDKAAQAAQEQTNRAAQAILTEIGKLGIPADRIRTSRLTLLPIYAPPRPNVREAPRIEAYTASNVVSVEVTNLAQIGPIIDAGLKAGANQLEGVQFRIKDDLPVRERALKQAVTEARRKAEVMAEALGVRIVGVLEVSESGSSVMPKGESERLVFAARATDETPVSPGQLEVNASVSVRYQIAPR